MQTLLAATDFSPSSLNACKYAAFLATKLHCKLFVFNLSELPIAHTNSGLYFISHNVLAEDTENKMQSTIATIKATYPKLEVEPLLLSGSFKAEITQFIKKHKVRAVVLGLGAKTKLNKYIFGSHSTDIVGKIEAPVIIVPEKFKTYSCKHITLAVDNNEKLARSPILQFQELATDLKAKLKFIHIRTEDELFHPQVLAITLKSKMYKIETILAKSIQEGINYYCKKNESDLIAVLSHKHSTFYDLFSESTTKKIAFITKIPVISIHQ